MASWDALGLQEQDSTNLLLAAADPFPVSTRGVLLTPDVFYCPLPFTPLSPFSPLRPAAPGVPKIRSKSVRAKPSHREAAAGRQ